jgi:hypothetical protein
MSRPLQKNDCSQPSLLLILFLFFSTNILSAQWGDVGSAGFSSGTASYLSMCMDGSTPYAAYQDAGNSDKATVMKYDGTNWITVGLSGFSSGAAPGLSMDLDGGTPYVVYSDGANSDKATVMKYDGTNWVIVGSAGFSAGSVAHTSINMNGSTPYVSYQDAGNSNKATVMKYDGSNWVNEGTAGFSASVVYNTSLRFDGSTPYIAYKDLSNSFKATVMKYDGSNWVVVGAAGFSAGQANYISLCMDGSTPYIVYQDNANSNKATVMKYDGSNWVVIGSAGFSAGTTTFTSISIYESTPYVAYNDWSNSNKVTVMKYDGSNWVAVGSAGFSASSAIYTFISMNGNTPYVAYQDGGNSSKATVMKFQGCCSATNNIPTATGTYTSTCSTTDGAGWTYYCDASDNLLLALEVGSSGAVIADDEVQLNIGATTTSTYAQYCGGGTPSCFIDLPDGATVFNRSWDVNPTTQPSAGNVGMKFYYTQVEYDAVDAAVTGGLSGMEEMWFYKVTNGETFPTIPSLEASEVTILTNDATTPATDKWVMGTKVASSEYFAEYMVSSFSGGGGGGSVGGLAPLPIELIYFHVYADGDDAKLKWSTASETNNRGFEIQHSMDGEDWENLGFIDGIGNSNAVTDYNFTHEEPRVGINYYRLKQIDLDGKIEFLLIENIHFASNQNEPINIYPNPAKDFLNITNVKGQGKIYNFSGQLIMEVNLTEDGINTINVNELGQGIFHLVVIKGNGERVIKRFMK